MEFNVEIRLLGEGAIMPTRATEGSSGYDFYCYSSDIKVLMPGASATIHTGVSLHILDPSVALLMFSRSGHGFKHSVRLINSVGVIDSDYQGEIMVKLRNDGPDPFEIKRDDKIAQGVFTKTPTPMWRLVKEFTSTTDRGRGGFGSTGR